MKPIPWMAEMSSLSWVSNLASYLMAAIWVAKTYYCSSRTEDTFYWKAKNYYLLSPRIVFFMALMSSLIFFCFWARAYSSYICSSIQSFSLVGAGGCLGWILGFLMELTRPPFYFSLKAMVSFSLATYLATGTYLGCSSLSLYLSRYFLG